MQLPFYWILLFCLFISLLIHGVAWSFFPKPFDSSGKWSKVLVTGNLLATALIPLSPSLAELAPAPWSENIQLEVLEEAPTGSSYPKIGDLVAIRFKASYNNVVFDNTFKTEDPFYFRVGVGSVVKGLDEVVQHMKEGERVHVRFGGDLAFGRKGLSAAPGRPRIPPNAILDYDVNYVNYNSLNIFTNSLQQVRLTQIPGAKEADIVEME